MITSIKRVICLSAALIAVATVLPLTVNAETVTLPDGAKFDTSAICPVCDMKVGAGRLGPAAVVFKDGEVVPFDGSGDLFRYLLSPSKYGFEPANIKAVFVTENNSKKFIDAKKAFYVLGSDVTGGMGLEAIAFAKKDDAEKFKAAHKGKRVAGFSEVTISDLRAGKKKMLKMKH